MMPPRIGKTSLLFASTVLLCMHAQAADSRVSVAVSPNPVSEHESVQLQVIVESPLSTPVLQPSFDSPDLTLMGAPGLNFQPVNSDAGVNTRKKLTFTFVLMPKKAGTFSITNIRTKIGGTVFGAPNVQIKVTPDNGRSRPYVPLPSQPKTPWQEEDDEESTNPAAPNYGRNSNAPAQQQGNKSIKSPDRFNSDFTVFASVSKSKAYVGEPVVVEYYLYDFGGLRQTEVLKWPTFDGFWKEDLELSTQLSFDPVYLQGQEMRRGFIARYALYGIKPGKIELDKLGIRGKYMQMGSRNNGGFFFAMDLRTGEHYSQEAWVEVIPLPTEGKPEKFSGGVGKFALKLEADKLSVLQNTPITFKITLSGTGNFQAIDSIKLPLPADFELYESTANGRSAAPIGVRQDLASQKTFQIIAIPRKDGKFEVPPISWSYFNTEKGAYETLSTNPLTVEVQPNNSPNASNQNYIGKSGGAAPAKQELRYLKAVNLQAADPKNYFNGALAAALIANLILGFGVLRSRSRRLYHMVRNIDPFSRARNLLLQAKSGHDGEWQAVLEEVIFTMLQVLIETNPRGLTKHDLEDHWKSHNLPSELFTRVSNLLEELDRHRFSSQKLTGSGSNQLRSRITKEAESLLVEASKANK